MNTIADKLTFIRENGLWVRECEAGPVKFIIVDPHDDEEWLLVVMRYWMSLVICFFRGVQTTIEMIDVEG